jgi:NAD(P)-dependent dehydrogenase (short-subunit alcohol dehydrogenase family)
VGACDGGQPKRRNVHHALCHRANVGAGEGVIIIVASAAALGGGFAGAAYTASKHTVVGLTKSTAVMFGKRGIRCVGICPGAVNTGIPLGGTPSEFGYEALRPGMNAIPRRRAGRTGGRHPDVGRGRRELHQRRDHRSRWRLDGPRVSGRLRDGSGYLEKIKITGWCRAEDLQAAAVVDLRSR